MIRRALSLELLRKFRADSSISTGKKRHSAELDNLRQVALRSRAISNQDDQILRRKLRQVRRYS